MDGRGHTVGFCVTHVCHHWRNAVLRLPTLWTRIDTNANVSFIEEILARSGQLLIEVKTKSERSCPAALSRVLEDIHRVRSLDLSLPHETYRSLDRFNKSSAPSVQSLPLASGDNGHLLPLLFDDWDMLVLQRLQTLSYSINWSSPIFRSTLTSLVIDSVMDFTPLPSILEMLNVLENFPLLENLTLRDALHLRHHCHIIPPPIRIARLPRLIYLSVSGLPRSCAYLLEHLSFPGTATQYLRFKRIQTAEHLQQIIPSVLEKLEKVASTTCEATAHALHDLSIWPHSSGLTYYARIPSTIL